MLMLRFLLSFVFLVTMASICSATNLVISSASLKDKDTGNDTYDIEFTTAWDNSWRIQDAPSITANWDAVWIFAKFSKKSGSTWDAWKHCTLLNTGTVTPSGATLTLASTGGVYKGAFLYRDSEGNGSVTFSAAQLRWAYGTDGVADNDTVKVRVFGIEMVYVPQGEFYVGDTAKGTTNCFYEGGTTHEFRVASELAITIGNSAGQLYYNADTADAGDRSGPIPDAFPKGYAAFYLMKYEVSQRQYAEFLNTLTTAQQANRWATGNFNTNRYFIKKASNGKFGTDADNDAGADGSADWVLMNETTDGQWTACNFLSWMDLAAYADWAALRPMTELEFEKAARGPEVAVSLEYAWGNATVETATASLTGSGTSAEAPDAGNINYSSASPDGPFRVGAFARAGSTRQNAGAGYYGALDLSGNLWERPVTVGHSTGRSFDGTSGDGLLSDAGHANTANWPGLASGEVTAATGSGFRGGTWIYDSSYARVSARYYAANDNGYRNYNYGARLARTAP